MGLILILVVYSPHYNENMTDMCDLIEPEKFVTGHVPVNPKPQIMNKTWKVGM